MLFISIYNQTIFMYINKTKIYSNLLSLNELKQHLRIDESDSSYDAEISRLIKVAISEAETFVQRDIAPTTTTIEDYKIYSSYYEVMEPNISLIGVTSITSTNVSTTGITPNQVFKNLMSTFLKFDSSLNAEQLIIKYSSGFMVLPDDIKHAIKIKVTEYFDADRSGYVMNNQVNTKAFMRLLANHFNY